MSAIVASYGNVSAAGVLLFVAVLLFTGQLIPRRVYKDMVEQRDKWEETATKLQTREAEVYVSRMEANTEALDAVQQSFNAVLRNRSGDKESST